jgi:hypothetical protein
VAAIAILAFITLGVVLSVDREMRTSEMRRTHIAGLLWLLAIGLAASVLYTVELSALGKIEMDGDSSLYVETAEGLLDGRGTASNYPVYDYFLAALLWQGNPFVARLGQLLLLACSYSLAALGLVRLGLGPGTLRWYAGFVCFNGIFYGLITQLVRDSLTLLAFALAFFCLASLDSSRNRVLRTGAALAGGLGAALFFVLSNWLPFVVALAVAAEVVGGLFAGARRRRTLGLIVGVSVVAMIAVALQSEQFAWLYKVNIEDDTPRQVALSVYGVYSPRSSLDIARNALGPGLIRPLLWRQYFWYSTNAHSGFYWWGTLVWYLLLLTAVPSLLLNAGWLRSKRGVRFCLTAVIALLCIYSYTYGSGVGMRKRAIFQFLTLLGLCAAGCFEGRSRSRDWMGNLLTDGPKAVLTGAMFAGMVVANYLSTD